MPDAGDIPLREVTARGDLGTGDDLGNGQGWAPRKVSGLCFEEKLVSVLRCDPCAGEFHHMGHVACDRDRIGVALTICQVARHPIGLHPRQDRVEEAHGDGEHHPLAVSVGCHLVGRTPVQTALAAGDARPRGPGEEPLHQHLFGAGRERLSD